MKLNGTREATRCRALEVILRTLHLTPQTVTEKCLGTGLLESPQRTDERRSHETHQEACVVTETRDDGGRTQDHWDKEMPVSSDTQGFS